MSLLDTASLIVTPNGYKEGTLYSVIPSDGSGDMSVVRATTATRVNSAGLVELVPYNLVTWSQDFSNAAWASSQVAIASNSTTAPDGTLTAETLTASTSNAAHYIFQGINTNSGSTVTFSCFVKNNGGNYVQLLAGGISFTISNPYQNFNLINGTLAQGNIPTSTIENVGNGWFRISYTVEAISSGSGNYLLCPILSGTTGRLDAFTGNGTSGIFIWGAQLVEGTLPKDYQKTETRLNIPRLDYSNGTCPSLLVEPQRTNICTYSNDFTNASYTKILATLTPNFGISPDGTQNSTKIVFEADAQIFKLIGSQVNPVSSIYIKGVNGETIQFFNNQTNGYITKTLNGTWQRFIDITSGTAFSYIAIGTLGGVTARVVEIYGAQFELGTYPTSYIPTTSASVTRNADVISKTGISSLIGQSEGTLYFEGIAEYNTEICSINQNTQNSIFIYSAGGYGVFGYIYADGSNVTFASFVNPLTKFKAAIAYKTNSMAMYINGNLIQEYTGFSFTPNAALTTLFIAQGGYVQGKEKVQADAIALWKTRLTNTQLAQLTTI